MAKDYVKRPVRQRRNVPKQLVTLLASFLCGYLTATVFDFTSLSAWLNQHVLKNQELPAEKIQVAKQQIVKPKFEFYTLLAKDNNIPPASTNNRITVASVRNQQPTIPQLLPNSAMQGAALQGAGNAQQTQSQTVVGQRAPINSTTQPSNQQVRQAVVPVDNKENLLATRHSREAFLIQIAAFNRRQDAEHLKAALVLRGFDVAISPILKNNINWYRVVVGPFPSRAEAEKAQIAVARSEHMKGMIRKIDV
ncbi:Sporulation domain-containing protein [Legionella busanensis]|uniref:Sporulation domain-containing protein n=1 Tax=Legionella busanensis TaxID=190655 RepID=A0A378JGZ8_9GAMM|nr:SPOR domain-containing protein [Legionella busanensis]STX50576.1 Sporulation domain-containing protein [Legionella busanensis]